MVFINQEKTDLIAREHPGEIVKGPPATKIGCVEADLYSSTNSYTKRFSGPAGEWMLSVQNQNIREMIAPWKGGTVLDVGGGHGQIASLLMADGHDVTVLSSSPAAYGRAAMLDPVPHLKAGDLLNPPFEDQSFDVVTAVRMMAHVGDWEHFVACLCRIARHAVIIDFPIPGGVNALKPLFFGTKKWLEGDTRKFATIKTSAVRETFADHGFTRSRERGQFVLPMVLHRKLGRPDISSKLEKALERAGLLRMIGTPVIYRALRDKSDPA